MHAGLDMYDDDVIQDIKIGKFFTEVIDRCSGCLTPCPECDMKKKTDIRLQDNPDGVDYTDFIETSELGHADKFNPVHKPEHYMLIPEKDVQVKDVVKAVVNECYDLSGYQCHCLASAIEYLLRAHKKNGLQDYQKARKLLEFAFDE